MSHAFYISPHGNDRWSGRLAEPNTDGSDGPFATIEQARTEMRTLKSAGASSQPVTVWLRGGSFHVAAPLVFGPDDSGPVTYAAYPGEQPIIDGGRRIRGWRRERVNERACWAVDLAEVAAGEWDFRQLWVNGKRRSRSRVPK